MFRIIRVTGESLSPFYQEGDYVVVATVPFLIKRVRPGDTLVFHHSTYGLLIKQVSRRMEPGNLLEVAGTNPNSVDSRQFGPVPVTAVIGKVIWRIPKTRR